MPRTILRPYIHTIRNRLAIGGARNQKRDKHAGQRDLLMLFITAVVMYCIYAGFRTILRVVSGDPLLEIIIPEKIIGLLYYAFLLLLILSNTIAAMGNIYTAQNMELLMVTPVSNTRLFFAKLIETLTETTLMLVVFLLPVGLAFHFNLDIHPWFLVAAVLISLPFLVIPTCVGIIFATFFARFASIVWRRGLFLLICVVTLGGWGIVRLISSLRNVQISRGGENAIVQMIGLFDNPNPIWSPARWSSDLLNYFVTGNTASWGINILLLIGTAVGFVGFAFLVFDTFLLEVRTAAKVHARVRSKEPSWRQDPVKFLLVNLYRFAPIENQLRAIIVKDLTSLVRDRAQALQLLLYLGIALIYLVVIEFMSTALNMAPVAQQLWWAFLGAVNVLFSGFILTALMTRLVYPSISLEGRSFWILLTGPIALRRMIDAKYWCWFPFTLFVGCSLLVVGVIAIHFNVAFMLVTLLVGISLSIGLTGLSIGVGSMFATFEWESPNQISAGFGTLVLLLTSLSLVLITTLPASALCTLALVPLLQERLGWGTIAAGTGVCALLVVGINTFVAIYACKRGAKSLAKRNL